MVGPSAHGRIREAGLEPQRPAAGWRMPASKREREREARLRPLRGEDVGRLKRALYLMVAWNPERALPPLEVLVNHPELARYHRDWGRPGDLGLIAEMDERFAGAVFCRSFTRENHGHGFIDAETPELGVAVVPEHRGVGLGTTLMEELADLARAAGFAHLSLSVDLENPARRLYRRLGYNEVSRDEGGVRMPRALRDD